MSGYHIKKVNKYVHHSRLYLEGLEIGIKLIVLHTRCMLWLPMIKAQDAP